MKSHTKFTRLLVLLPLIGGSLVADPSPQEQISFTAGGSGTWNADWLGVPHRVYTFQWSHDLENWHYAPFIDFGDGIHSRGCSSTSDKFFVRLHYLDAPEIDTLEEAQLASFDGEGLPIDWKVKNGLHPFDGTGINGPNGDLDGDGIPNYQDSRPNDDAIGAMSITITTPANSTTIP
jgi:hypothetical protein